MTKYDAYPKHPLCGVPQVVLDAARSVLQEAVECHDLDADMAHPIADAVVMVLHEAGFLTWPTNP